MKYTVVAAWDMEEISVTHVEAANPEGAVNTLRLLEANKLERSHPEVHWDDHLLAVAERLRPLAVFVGHHDNLL